MILQENNTGLFYGEITGITPFCFVDRPDRIRREVQMNFLKSRKLENCFGLLGVGSFLFYLLAVFVAPIAYPGYNAMGQAISDLSASNAPSRELWMQFTTVSSPMGLVSATLACLYVRNHLNKKLRAGVYVYAILSWVDTIGYAVFPLTESGYAGAWQDIVHVFVLSPIAVILSITTFLLMMVGGYRERRFRSIAILSTILLVCMLIGTVGLGIAPLGYGGLMERIAIFPGTGFSLVLGLYLFFGFDRMERDRPAVSASGKAARANDSGAMFIVC